MRLNRLHSRMLSLVLVMAFAGTVHAADCLQDILAPQLEATRGSDAWHCPVRWDEQTEPRCSQLSEEFGADSQLAACLGWDHDAWAGEPVTSEHDWIHPILASRVLGAGTDSLLIIESGSPQPRIALVVRSAGKIAVSARGRFPKEDFSGERYSRAEWFEFPNGQPAVRVLGSDGASGVGFGRESFGYHYFLLSDQRLDRVLVHSIESNSDYPAPARDGQRCWDAESSRSEIKFATGNVASAWPDVVLTEHASVGVTCESEGAKRVAPTQTTTLQRYRWKGDGYVREP